MLAIIPTIKPTAAPARIYHKLLLRANSTVPTAAPKTRPKPLPIAILLAIQASTTNKGLKRYQFYTQ